MPVQIAVSTARICALQDFDSITGLSFFLAILCASHLLSTNHHKFNKSEMQ